MRVLRDRVTILDATDSGSDSHGNPTRDWANATESVQPAQVVPVSSSETVVGGDFVGTRWSVTLLPSGAGDAQSRIMWRGDTFEVEGDVEYHTNARGKGSHRHLIMVRYTG